MHFQPYYVLRRPLLPIKTYFLVQEQLRGGMTLANVLKPWYEQPLVQQALYYASGEVHRQCRQWLLGTAAPSEKLLKTLYRYLVRMATRATPFGMCSGISMGEWGGQSGVLFDEGLPIRTHTRLDAQTLQQVLQAVCQLPDVRPLVRYRANSTTYAAGIDLRYIEASHSGSGLGRYALSITTNTHYMQRVLAAAQGGACVAELVAVLTHEGIPPADALNFVNHLIENQLLLSEFDTTLTDRNDLTRLIARLDTLTSQTALADLLRHVVATLPTANVAGCLAIEEALTPLTGAETGHLMQTDSYFPARQNTIGVGVKKALCQTLARVVRFNRPTVSVDLNLFRQRFYERYEEQEVPLLLALDPDIGIGYGGSTISSALLDGITWPEAHGADMPFTKQYQAVLRLYTEAMRRAEPLLVLTDADLTALTDGQTEPSLPPGGYWMGHLLAESAEAIDGGNWLFHLVTAGGPSAGNLLGRMAHLDPDLEAQLQASLRHEEASDPDALWAEIIHLPEPRTANVLTRPVLRAYEIPILSVSGVDDTHQIPLDDLLVSVPQGRHIVLRSRRLNKRVIPRLSTAHNFSHGLAHYRFLCDLQTQGGTLHVGWDWGPLASLPHLPQVRYENVILCRASWTVTATTGTKPDWVATWRAQYAVPRYVVLTDADNELPLDLESELSCALLTDKLSRQASVQVKEWLLNPQTCWAGGDADRWVSELILPTAFAVPAPPVVAPVRTVSSLRRSFSPGSEWFYLKVITGEQATEQLLVSELPLMVRTLREAGVLQQWFFVRYNHPEPHLRLRFQSEPGQETNMLTHLLAWVQRLTTENGTMFRVQVDTYHREVERYGSDRMLACETWFCLESDRLLPVLMDISQRDETHRLFYACALTHRLLMAWHCSLAQCERLVASCCDAFGREFRADKSLLVQLDQQYRRYRMLVHDALTVADVSTAIDRFYADFDTLIAQLTPTLAIDEERTDLLASLVHMLLNRVFSTQNRRHEYLTYYLLKKEYTSLLKRKPQPAT